MIHLLIADDHAVVREGLKHIFEVEPGISVVGEATSGHEILAFLRKRSCDVVILDISMPGRDGLDVLRDIRKEFPRLPVLVLSMHEETQFGVRAFRLGAAGYLTKGGPPAEIIRAVRIITSGGKFVIPSLAEKLACAADMTWDQPPHASLSDREFEIFRMAAGGKTPSEMAEELAISIKTVSSYRTRILRKLNAKNFAQVIRYAIEHRILE